MDPKTGATVNVFAPQPGKLGLFDFPDELLPWLGLTKVTAPKDNDKRSGGGIDQ